MAPVATPTGLSHLVKSLVTSYQTEPRTSHIGTANLPSRDEVTEIIELFRELLFPGYFGKQDLRLETLEYHVGDNLAALHDRLFQQIHSAFRHQVLRSGGSVEDAVDRTSVVVQEVLGTLPQLRGILATDVQAAFDGDPAATSLDENIFSYPGVLALTVYRVAHELHKREVPLIPRIMSEYAHSRTGIDIHPGAVIGDHFFIDHGTGVVIGETVIIGSHVKLYQGVTLGATSTRGGQTLRGVKRHPTLKDHVTIYSGASVLGGDTIIGEGAVINGNAFITQSVPAHTRVSVKNPELYYKNGKAREFKQALPSDYVI